MRLIIAAILGGLVMFAWGFVSHVVLGIEDSSVKSVPNEAAVVSALRSNISDPGFYFIPGMDKGHSLSAEEQAAWMEKYAAGPDAMSPKQFGTEFASNVAVAFVVGLILLFASVGFVRGVIISTLAGAAGWLAIMVSYWNWFRFPTQFVVGEFIDQVAGFFLMGLVVAFILKKRV